MEDKNALSKEEGVGGWATILHPQSLQFEQICPVAWHRYSARMPKLFAAFLTSAGVLHILHILANDNHKQPSISFHRRCKKADLSNFIRMFQLNCSKSCLAVVTFGGEKNRWIFLSRQNFTILQSNREERPSLVEFYSPNNL